MILGCIHLILLFDTESQSSSKQIWTVLVETKYPSFHAFFNVVLKESITLSTTFGLGGM